jgi:hypothetical protein
MRSHCWMCTLGDPAVCAQTTSQWGSLWFLSQKWLHPCCSSARPGPPSSKISKEQGVSTDPQIRLVAKFQRQLFSCLWTLLGSVDGRMPLAWSGGGVATLAGQWLLVLDRSLFISGIKMAGCYLAVFPCVQATRMSQNFCALSSLRACTLDRESYGEKPLLFQEASVRLQHFIKNLTSPLHFPL